METVINDGKQIQTEVMLGATDGAYIEILSGVNEGRYNFIGYSPKS